MHDLVEHGLVVCVIGWTVNFRERNVLGILRAVTALPQFVAEDHSMKSFAYEEFRMKWFASAASETSEPLTYSDSPQKLRKMRGMAESSAHIRPMRWLAHLPLAILPFLAAAVTEAPRLGRDLDARINAALAQAGQGWAKPALSGRDVEVRGMAPDRAAAAAARAAVEATEGVRRVEMRIGVGAP